MIEGVSVYKLIFDDKGIVIDGIVEYMNPATVETMGLSSVDVIGKSAIDVSGLDFIQPHLNAINGYLIGNENRFEVYYAPTDKFFLVSGFDMHNNLFAVLRVDITEHRKSEKQIKSLLEETNEFAEELESSNEELKATTDELQKQQNELKTSENRFRSLYENSFDAILLTKPDGSILSANPAAQRMFDRTEEEIVKAGRDGLVVNDKNLKRAIMEREQKGSVKSEFIYKKRDGSAFPGEGTSSIFYDADGTVKTSMIIRDLTERKKAEEELKQARDHLEEQVEERTAELEEVNLSLKESEEKLRAYATELEQSTGEIRRSQIELEVLHRKYHDLFNTAPVGYITLNPEGIITEVNDTIVELMGFPKSHFNMNVFTLFVAPNSKDTFYRVLTNVNMVKRQTKELELTKIDGTTFCALTEFVFSRDDRQFKLAITDITERKKAEEQLNETITELNRSNKELQSFAYITSHDLQEPLRTIASYAQLIERRYKGKIDNDADEFIEFMIDGSFRMKEMIQGLLEYSRVGTRGHQFKEFPAKTALNYALSNLGATIAETDAEIKSDSLPVICADEGQIIRLFQNLIENGIKFRKEGIRPKIHISSNKNDNEYVFSVRDNGIGLEEQYSDKIFEVFKRLHAIGEYQGTGIGLAIVKRIIDRHRGKIWVESELGEGSTFYFTIPVKK